MSIAFKVVILGDSYTGKTSLAYRWKEGQYTLHQATLSCTFYSKSVHKRNKSQVLLQIVDTSGQERFNSIPPSAYRGVSGIFLAFALDDRQSFEHVRKWRREAQKHLSDLPLWFLVGTKSDTERQVNFDEASELKDELGLQFYMETSAKNGIGVDDLFQEAGNYFLKKYQTDERYKEYAKGISSSVVITSFSGKSFIEKQREQIKKKKKKKMTCSLI